MDIIICQKCKKEFKNYLSNKRKFCSRKCYWKSLIGRKQPEWWIEMIRKHNSGNKYVLGKHWKVSKKRTLAMKKRYSEAKKGIKFSEKHKEKISISNGGNGKSDRTNKRYYHLNDAKHKEWRDKIFKRDNWICQTCGKGGCYLEPHHIKGWSKYPKLRYDVKNGVTLCIECHRLTRKKNVSNKKQI